MEWRGRKIPFRRDSWAKRLDKEIFFKLPSGERKRFARYEIFIVEEKPAVLAQESHKGGLKVFYFLTEFIL